MNIGQQVRQGAIGVEAAAFNASMVKFVSFEAVVIAVVIGFANRSWSWGLGLFFGLIVAMMIPAIRILTALALSAMWGAAAYWIVGIMAAPDRIAPIIAGIAALLLSLAAHAAFFQWRRDFKSST